MAKTSKSTFDREMENEDFRKAFERSELQDKVTGLTVEEAGKHWDDIRVAFIDGKPCVHTRDYVPGRMNVVVKNNLIVGIYSFG